MNKNIECLLKACKISNLAFEILDEESSSVVVKKGGEKFYFIQTASPLNSTSHSKICKDKELSYILLNKLINMPETKAYIDPNLRMKYRNLVQIKSLEEVAEKIEMDFFHKCNRALIKPNSGQNGINVAIVSNKEEILEALTKIFNKKSKDYDYAVVVQEIIEIENEYRIVTVKGKIELAYEKTSNSKVRKIGLGAVNMATEIVALEEFQKFINPIFNEVNIGFCGLDIARDRNGKLWLIELNAQPGLDYFMRHNGETRVVELYTKVIESL